MLTWAAAVANRVVAFTSRKTFSFYLWNSHIYCIFLGTSMDFATPSSKLVKIPGHKYYFVPTGTQPGHRPKFWDCPSQTRTLGNYEVILMISTGLWLVLHVSRRNMACICSGHGWWVWLCMMTNIKTLFVILVGRAKWFKVDFSWSVMFTSCSDA